MPVKDDMIVVRVTARQRAMLEEAAALQEEKMSEFVRRVALAAAARELRASGSRLEKKKQ